MQPWGRGGLQAEPFSFAATKIRIGRGPRCRYGRCRRNNSLLRQRKLESDADLVAATTDAGGPFLTAAAMTLHRFPSLHLEALTVAAERVLMRPEAAYPYVSAAEGAQHPPKRPPRSTTTAGGVSRWKER